MESLQIQAVNVYPFLSFHFSEKDPKPEKDSSADDRLARLRENYYRNGVRKTVGAVLLVQKEGDPYLMLMKRKTTGILELPGGRRKDGEDEIQCLKRKLTSQLALPGDQPNWETLEASQGVKTCKFKMADSLLQENFLLISECVAMWWRIGFDGRFSSYLHDEIADAKECRRIFIVQLFKGMHFAVPENFELVIVPFSSIYNNARTWGHVISSIPVQLSRFLLNYPE